MRRAQLARAAFFGAALLFALVALVPLRLAADWLDLDRRGFSARGATGSLWLGAFHDARFGSIALGNLGARLRLLPLLLGRARLDFDGGREVEGGVTVTRHGFGFDEVSGTFETGPTFDPLPLAAIELRGLSVRFERDRCAAAAGAVRARITGAAGGIPLPGEASGAARCDGPALLLPLAGPSGMEALHLRIRADGRWLADLIVRPPDDAARDRLVAAGFRLMRGGYSLRLEGIL